MPEDFLATLRELDQRDRQLAAEADRQRLLDAAVAEIRGRAEKIAEFFGAHASENDRLRAIEAREQATLDQRRAELADATAAAEEARSDEDRVLAEKRLARAVDHVALAERALDDARSARRALDEEAQRLTHELPELEERARAMGGAANEDLIQWSSRKHAELFIALGLLDQQRDRVIREANELATAILGEPTFGSTPAQALEQVERYWTSSPGHVSESR